MRQHLHRREFIQASAAAAGVIAAAGLPRPSRAASSPTIDAQVHAYERNHPGRPWAGTLVGPAEMTGGEMVSAMDAVGVDGAVLVSPFSMYRYDPSYVLEVRAKHPDRFCLVKPVDPNDPAVADIIADWKAKKGTVGVRVIMRDNVATDPATPASTGSGGGGEAFTGGKPALLGAVGTGGTIGGPQSEHAARHRPPGLTAAVRAATAGAALGRIAEGAGARGVSQCCHQDHRCLHAGARTVPVPRHLGPARPHLRRLWLRPLHVGHRLDARG